MDIDADSLPQKPLRYRPDIDGLRAVAVLSVLAFHMGKFRMPGGFVGVDVFFVISGYLISFIVFSEIANSSYSIVSFYERRIRRIFPALFGMLAVFTVFSVIYLLPVELVDYGKSMMAATASVANFYFWLHSGYFDSPTISPLLHTWSLGVEEQFYIVLPIFLIAVRHFFPQRLRITAVVLFFLSLGASAWVVYGHPMTAFYMLYTRAWELLMGTALSLGMFPRLKDPLLRNAATVAGIALIAFAVFSYSDETRFPGLSALVPCVGSTLIIGAGESGSSIVGTVLSWKPIVFIGLISYSLYLWHWPVVVAQHLGVFGPMEHGTVAIASLVLGFLSWRFVERPFRSGGLRLTGRPLFLAAGCVMAFFTAVSLFFISTAGIRGRFPARAERVAAGLHDTADNGQSVRLHSCFLLPEDSFDDFRPDVCMHPDPTRKSYVLVGNSHAADLWMALSQSIPDANILQVTATPCSPFLHPIGSTACKKLMNLVYQSYLPEHPVQGLWISSRWKDPSVSALTETIDWAKSHHVPVVLFGPVPEYDEALPRLLAYSIAWNEPDLPSRHRVAYPRALDAKLQDLAANYWHIPYVSFYQAICDKDICTEYADDAHQTPLMDDGDHLSREGALLVIHRLIARGELPGVERVPDPK